MLAACGPANAFLPNSASGHDEVGKARQNGSRLGVDDLRQTLDGGGGAVPGSFQERLHALLNGTGGEGIFQARSELLNAGGVNPPGESGDSTLIETMLPHRYSNRYRRFAPISRAAYLRSIH